MHHVSCSPTLPDAPGRNCLLTRRVDFAIRICRKSRTGQFANARRSCEPAGSDSLGSDAIHGVLPSMGVSPEDRAESVSQLLPAPSRLPRGSGQLLGFPAHWRSPPLQRSRAQPNGLTDRANSPRCRSNPRQRGRNSPRSRSNSSPCGTNSRWYRSHSREGSAIRSCRGPVCGRRAGIQGHHQETAAASAPIRSSTGAIDAHPGAIDAHPARTCRRSHGTRARPPRINRDPAAILLIPPQSLGVSPHPPSRSPQPGARPKRSDPVSPALDPPRPQCIAVAANQLLHRLNASPSRGNSDAYRGNVFPHRGD